MIFSSIRLGVYGAPGSGKTSFWRQLILGNRLPVPSGSKLSRFLVSSTTPEGQTLPTTTPIDNIEIRIGKTAFSFSDRGGGESAEFAFRLDGERRDGKSRNPLVRRILRSDAFFFFFDPTAAGRSSEQREKHQAAELLQAKRLIDYAVEARQNRFLPILFLLGRAEQLQSDPGLHAETEKWVDEVNDYLKQAYTRNLDGFYPRPLIRKEDVFCPVSLADAHGVAECLGIMEKTRFLVQLVKQFRRDDRKRARRLICAFIFFVLLVLFVPVLCLTSPTAKDLLLRVRERTAPIFDSLPALPASLTGEPSVFSEKAVELGPLFEADREFDGKTLSQLNRSLFILMKRLNKLEDSGAEESEEYRTRLRQWSEALENVEKRFDAETDLSSREKLEQFGTLLTALADSSKRTTPALDGILKKYWQRYRQTLVEEWRSDLAVHRAAGTPSRRIMDELCDRLESSFREVSEWPVRGNTAQKDSGETNKKESLKLDIKKALIACRNYSDRYPVEIKIQSATYHSAEEIDRDFFYRLVFDGGKEKSEVFVDLAISSGIENNTSFTFLPSRRNLTVSFALDHPLLLSLEWRKKGDQVKWEKKAAWEISSEGWNAVSLEPLGVLFYLRYENEENTFYDPEGHGFHYELIIRRPRSVPELLWEIVDPV